MQSKNLRNNAGKSAVFRHDLSITYDILKSCPTKRFEMFKNEMAPKKIEEITDNVIKVTLYQLLFFARCGGTVWI
jgi:hypothetical protein